MTLDGFSWDLIDDVLLDMDGTLLDRHFDNFFFEEELPRRYAALHGLAFEEAREHLMAMYRAAEGELDWTDLNYWTGRIGVDVVALTKELDGMIDFLPDAQDFLRHLRTLGKRVTILTNAHRSGVEIKIAKTGVNKYVDRIVTAFEVGYLKCGPSTGRVANGCSVSIPHGRCTSTTIRPAWPRPDGSALGISFIAPSPAPVSRLNHRRGFPLSKVFTL